jgi:hypothetical protein
LALFLINEPFYTPSFLLWLERYTGIWQQEDVRVSIDRRSDGALMARNSRGERQPLINFVSGDWTKIESLPRPSGLGTLLLSSTLISLWLEPKVAEKYAHAMFVSSGPRILLERIETAINETPLELRERKWVSSWKYNAESSPEPISVEDLVAHQTLYQRFLSEEAGTAGSEKQN